MSFNVGDRVILINGTSAVPSGSEGEVTQVAGKNVKVNFGVLLGTLMTTAQNLKLAGPVVAMNAPAASAGGGAVARKIHWALPAIGKAGSADATSLSATPAPSNGMSVSFDSAKIDLQGAGELTAVWATTLTFGLSGDVQKKAPVTLHVRGFIHTDKKASAVLLAYLDGKLHRQEFKRGKARSEDASGTFARRFRPTRPPTSCRWSCWRSAPRRRKTSPRPSTPSTSP